MGGNASGWICFDNGCNIIDTRSRLAWNYIWISEASGITILLTKWLLKINRISGDAEAQTPTLVTAKSLAMTAIDIMMSEELTQQMKNDFVEDMKKFNVE